MSRKTGTTITTAAEFNDSNRTFMTPAEIELVDKLKEDKDPFGDEEVDGDTLVADTLKALNEPAAAAVDEEAPAETAETDKPAAAAVDEEAPVVDEAAKTDEPAVAADGSPVDLRDLEGLRLVPLPAVDEAGYRSARAEIQAKIDEIDAQWEAGTIEPAARKATLAPLNDELDAARVAYSSQVGKWEAIAAINQQTTAAVLDRIKAAGVRDGLDYNDTVVQQQFDTVQNALALNPKNAGLSWVKKAELTDRTMRAMNGIVTKGAPVPVVAAPAPKPAAAVKTPSRAAPPTPPVTLRELPTAARAGEQGDTVAAKIAQGDANQKDAIWRGMTKQQRALALGE